MELSIQKWGNSAAMRLPAELLKQLKVSPGDKLTVSVLPDGVMLKPARKVYKLADLLAQCDKDAPPPADLELWNNIKPVGREIW
jgi:Growth regulator